LFTSAEFTEALKLFEAKSGSKVDTSTLFQWNDDGTLNIGAITKSLNELITTSNAQMSAEANAQKDILLEIMG
jgi:hypothetical protein